MNIKQYVLFFTISSVFGIPSLFSMHPNKHRPLAGKAQFTGPNRLQHKKENAAHREKNRKAQLAAAKAKQAAEQVKTTTNYTDNKKPDCTIVKPSKLKKNPNR